MQGDRDNGGSIQALEDRIRRLEAELARHPAPIRTTPPDRLTLDQFAERFFSQQEQLSIVSVDDSRTRWRLHAQARLGQFYLDEIRPKQIRALILDLRADGRLAPRTVRHVYAMLSSMFRYAVGEELITASPCCLPRGIVPPVIDKDPEWRAGAVFSREELQALVSDGRLIEWRRTMYALKGILGLRHGEAARAKWSHIEAREPLNCLLVPRNKTKTPRQVPIHVSAQWALDGWRLHGFVALIGRAPTPEDLIVPTRNGTQRQGTNTQRALLSDLQRLGWLRRRGHDLRRTMITLARSDGARDEVLRVITHGPRRDIQESYTSWPWRVLCDEMGKLALSVGQGVQGELALGSTGTGSAAHSAAPKSRARQGSSLRPSDSKPAYLDDDDECSEHLPEQRNRTSCAE